MLRCDRPERVLLAADQGKVLLFFLQVCRGLHPRSPPPPRNLL